jgi:RluA family pseudouridine synthase
VAKPANVELLDGDIIVPILYEDRSVIALDKLSGWMLAPDSWDRTGRNLQLALNSSISAGDFWAKARNLKYLRFVHRLDADTTGITLFARSVGALKAFSDLFEERQVEKTYLAVVKGIPKEASWSCDFALAPDPSHKGQMIALKGAAARDPRLTEEAKEAETHFRVLKAGKNTALVEARPMTGRTHQIRVHLAAAGHPIIGDTLYGGGLVSDAKGHRRLALRATKISYRDPFQKRVIHITAPTEEFLRENGFAPEAAPRQTPPPEKG